MSDLVATLRKAAGTHPDRTAIRCGAADYTYAELLTSAALFGHRLRSDGVVPGDRVALALPNAPGYAVAHYGALFAGGVVVPLNPLQPESDLAARLSDARPRLLVVADGAPPAVVRAADTAGVALFEIGDPSGGTQEIDAHSAVSRDPALIAYRSADDDVPTGVILSHENLDWSAAAAAAVLGLTETDTLACCFPLCHPLGQTYGLGATVAAGCCLALPGGGDVTNALSTVEAESATVLAIFPVLAGTTLEDRELAGRDLSRLRTVFFSGGASLGSRVRARLAANLDCEILEGYGTVETSALGCAARSGQPTPAGSVGTAVPGVEIAVADKRGREAVTRTPGHLLMKGPNVTAGYWERPGDTARAFHDGWLLTGQKARRDDEGNVYLLDGVWWTDSMRGKETGREGLLRRGLRKLRR